MDPRERREAVADAVFRIAVRDGLHRASLRTVAAEAELNVGSVRHYFDGHSALLRFAMRTMMDRVQDRLERRLAEWGDPAPIPAPTRDRLRVEALGELLPLDDARRAEITVFLEFGAAARTDPALAPLAREASDGTVTLVRRALRHALGEGREPELEVVRLTALLDGLGHLGVQQPDPLSAEQCLDVLRSHLREVRLPRGGEGQ